MIDVPVSPAMDKMLEQLVTFEVGVAPGRKDWMEAGLHVTFTAKEGLENRAACRVRWENFITKLSLALRVRLNESDSSGASPEQKTLQNNRADSEKWARVYPSLGKLRFDRDSRHSRRVAWLS